MVLMPASLILKLWEHGGDLPPAARALALAAAARPEEADELAAVPLGRRDARILHLGRALVGDRLEATATCPGCRELVEFGLDVDALLARAGAATATAPVEARGYAVSWRSPDTRDFAAAAAGEDVTAAEVVLLERCVLSATGPDGEVAASALPPEVRASLAAAMAEADPLAEVLIDLACPRCDEHFVADLDIAGFVWEEVRRRAHRLLDEVAALAVAFGWSEDEVLALSERRRAEYLGLARRGGA